MSELQRSTVESLRHLALWLRVYHDIRIRDGFKSANTMRWAQTVERIAREHGRKNLRR